MQQKLFTVEDRFKITGRGVVITGAQREDLPQIKLGVSVILITPDGTEISAEVAGVEDFRTVSGHKGIGILINNLTKEAVPVGTEIFLNAA